VNARSQPIAALIKTSEGESWMFESKPEQVEQLLNSNEEFKTLYNEHRQLEKRVLAAETGTAPMSDEAMNALKREKLRIKDRLTQLMDESGL
jgi:uncharacterized protein YdcH (DUF465 family)